MNIKNFSIGVLSIAVLLIVGFSFKPQALPRPEVAFGGTSPDISSPYVSVNNVLHWYARGVLTSSTTPCAIQSPNATTSYEFASAQITTSSTTATTWTVARALSAFATTTQLAQFSLGSGVMGSMIVNASTTAAVDGAGILPPNTWIVWGVAGTAIGDPTKLNGSCQAEFIQVS